MGNTYFTSDIHGEYDLLMKLLDKAKFSDNDTLYILGDLVDKGTRSVAAVRFARTTPNVFCIAGNHDFAIVRHYQNLMRNFCDGDDIDNVLQQLREMFTDDGDDLCWEDIDFLERLPFYTKGNGFVCVHAGVKLSDDGTFDLERQPTYELLCNRDFVKPRVVPAPSMPTVLFGHTPTKYFNDNGNFLFTPKANISDPTELTDYAKICLDCGVWLCGKLGLLRKEDMQTFYATK